MYPPYGRHSGKTIHWIVFLLRNDPRDPEAQTVEPDDGRAPDAVRRTKERRGDAPTTAAVHAVLRVAALSGAAVRWRA